ncbi:MAG TPA: response regulator, partial [Terriglobia bacterium]|nr:response regulator [Terriglobia bacterium]
MDIQILVASQDKSLLDLCFKASKMMGLEATIAGVAFDAINTVKADGADIILADARMPGLDVVELIKAARAASPGSEVVVMATAGDAALARHAVNQGAHDCLIGPLAGNDLERLLSRLIQQREMAAENRLLREQLQARQGLGALIGASARMQSVYEVILKVATKRHPVLVLGESGTGKELVARAIHSYGP